MRQLMLFSVHGFIHDHKSLLVTLFIGAVAGILAQLLTPGRGFRLIGTVIIGIAGGWLGGMLFKNYLSFTDKPLVNEIICATAGALILCIVINLVMGKSKNEKDRTDRQA